MNIHELMPRAAIDPRLYKTIGERLQLAREAIGMKQGQYATLADVSPTAYNQWERGSQGPGIQYAIKICDRHGLTLDWIYRGKYDGLPTWLSNAIRGLEEARKRNPPAPKVVQPKRRHRAA